MKRFFFIMAIFAFSQAYAYTFEEQGCERGNLQDCATVCSWGSGYEWACDILEDSSNTVPMTITETEMEIGCNPWVEYNEAKNRAKDKLENKPVPQGASPWVVTSCRALGTYRWFPDLYNGIHIFSEYTTQACPKYLNWNKSFSNIGRMYTIAAQCTATR